MYNTFQDVTHVQIDCQFVQNSHLEAFHADFTWKLCELPIKSPPAYTVVAIDLAKAGFTQTVADFYKWAGTIIQVKILLKKRNCDKR